MSHAALIYDHVSSATSVSITTDLLKLGCRLARPVVVPVRMVLEGQALIGSRGDRVVCLGGEAQGLKGLDDLLFENHVSGARGAGCDEGAGRGSKTSPGEHA